MEELFASLTRASEGAPLVATGAAALWGVLSVALSPCHLASMPLLVAYIANRRARSANDALWISVAFALGVIVTIAVIGIITAGAGRIAGDLGPAAGYVVAGVFLLVGLHLIGAIDLPISTAEPDETRASRGLRGAFLLGIAFGSALGPCTFAFMAPVLAAAFGAASSEPWFAVGLIAAFGLGHSSILIVAGVSTGAVQRWLSYSNRSRAIEKLRIASGILVIIGGLVILYTA